MSSNDWNYGPDHRKKQGNEELGEKIQSLVEGAIDSVDFDGLSEKIKSTIEDAVPRVQQMGQDWQRQMMDNRQKVYEQRVDAQRKAEQVKKAPVMKPREELAVYRELPGKYSGPIAIAAGTVGLIATGGVAISSGVGLFMAGAALAGKIALGIFGAVGVGFASLLGRGVFLEKKVKRYMQYQYLWKNKSHITIEDLHKKSGIPEKQITKDLHNIVDAKLLPVSYMDEQETCIILDEEVYAQYQAAEESRRQREAELEKQRLEEEAMAQAPKNVKLRRQIVQDEKYFLDEIQAKKMLISSEEVRCKIDTLSDMVSKIYDCVEQYPEQYAEIYRVKDYYLPTVIKLLGTYAQVENQPIQKENIIKTKKEIEDSLDMMNQAMEVMFDDLFRDVAMDTSADVSVLETMLARDGWNGPKLTPDAHAKDPLVF